MDEWDPKGWGRGGGSSGGGRVREREVVGEGREAEVTSGGKAEEAGGRLSRASLLVWNLT